MPLLKKRRVLAAALETTMGTGVSLTATNTMINAYDVVIDADIPYYERTAQGSFSRLAGVPGTEAGSLKFKLDLYGSGTATTAPAWALVLLEACGLPQSGGVFSLNTAVANQKSATIGVYEDGMLKKLTGAMGAVSFEGKDGMPVVLTFDFKGVWNAPTDTAMIAPTQAAIVPPRFAGATLSIAGSYTPTISAFSLKIGNKVELRQDVTQGSGFISALITDRTIEGTLDPEAVAVATYDAFGTWIAGTAASLSCTVGTSPNGFTFALPDIQYKSIKEGDRNGLVTHTLDYVGTCGVTLESDLTITCL